MSQQDTFPPFPVQAGVEFRHIPGWPKYAVTDTGEVWSCYLRYAETVPQWRKLSAILNQGYHTVGLYRDKKVKMTKVHRLVLLAFVGPCPQGKEVAHRDGVRNHNLLSNLRYATIRENQADRVHHGTSNRGSQSGSAVLTTSEVISIREMQAKGLKATEVAKIYHVSAQTIRDIWKRRKWKHLPN